MKKEKKKEKEKKLTKIFVRKNIEKMNKKK